MPAHSSYYESTLSGIKKLKIRYHATKILYILLQQPLKSTLCIAIAFSGHAHAQLVGSCSDVVVQQVTTTELLDLHPSHAATRAAAIRRALSEAISRTSGGSIATSFKSIDRSTLKSVTNQTDQKVAMRSMGYLNSWTIEHEKEIQDTSGAYSLQIKIKAEICRSVGKPLTQIVAIAPFEYSEEAVGPDYRELMISLFPKEKRFEITSTQPSDIYYDVIVSGKLVNVDISEVNNIKQIETLEHFLPDFNSLQAIQSTKRITVEVATKATGFIAENELNELTLRNRDIGAADNPDLVIRQLIREALEESLSNLYPRLISTY